MRGHRHKSPPGGPGPGVAARCRCPAAGRVRPAFRPPAGGSGGRQPAARAFTLVELMVAVAILATLAAIVAPPLMMARALAEKGVCTANIRLLQIANDLYQRENKGYYAPAAPHMFPVPDLGDERLVNMVRWFGRRESLTEPFSMQGGPLSGYLPHKVVQGCPSFNDYLVGFEAGCGGYGYNGSFVGEHIIPYGKSYLVASDRWHLSGNHITAFPDPEHTVAFTDAAFVHEGLMEYPFCEPPTWPLFGTEARPTIHFRHLGKTNVVWLDLHLSSERMSFSNDVMTGEPYVGSPADFDVGWFGPPNNSLFDCR